MDNDADAGGVGELELPPFVPALPSAIFELTGKKIGTFVFRLADLEGVKA